MTVPTIFETCRPRTDVLTGRITESHFAADLAQVINAEASDEYLNPERFFANTFPTRGLKNLLANVCRRLTGAGGEVASIFRLDTIYVSDNVSRSRVALHSFGHRLRYCV